MKKNIVLNENRINELEKKINGKKEDDKKTNSSISAEDRTCFLNMALSLDKCSAVQCPRSEFLGYKIKEIVGPVKSNCRIRTVYLDGQVEKCLIPPKDIELTKKMILSIGNQALSDKLQGLADRMVKENCEFQ